ncbi:MAG: diguanylate cyclase [Pseudomonadota bacterium]
MREPAADATRLDQRVTDSPSRRGKLQNWRLFIEVAALLALLAVGPSTQPMSIPLLGGALAIMVGAGVRWISRRGDAAPRHTARALLASTGVVAAGALLWIFAGVDLTFVLLAYAGIALLGVDADRLAPLASVHCLAVALFIACASVVGGPGSLAANLALGVFLLCAVGGQLLHSFGLRQALQASREELESLINMDRLTGLNNRQAFDAYVERVWRQSRRCAEKLSIVIVDLDFFGEFTERYGLPEGERCIQRVGGVLSSVGKRPLDYVARFGHSSFALILYDPATSYIRRLVSEVQSSVAALHIPNERSPIGPRLTISIGAVVLGPQSEKTLEATIEFAEKAVAGAKMRGGDRAVICESSDLRNTGTDSAAVNDRLAG